MYRVSPFTKVASIENLDLKQETALLKELA
jgi:hypothetical protein